MRLSTLPPIVVAIALLFGAAAQNPDSVGQVALTAVAFVVIGAWLTLEIGTEVAERWRRVRHPKNESPPHRDDPA